VLQTDDWVSDREVLWVPEWKRITYVTVEIVGIDARHLLILWLEKDPANV
jgi:hypothetical protein